MYHKSFLVGPDSTNPDGSHRHSVASRFFGRFLRNLQLNTVQRVSFHHYYFAGQTANITDYLNTTTMDTLNFEIDVIQALVQKYAPNTSVWIGETSTSWGGGTPGISNTFVEVFMWIDKLGIAAFKKIDVVIKETLIGGAYGLLTKDANPTPNYFASLLFKALVGRKVLERPKVQQKQARTKIFNYQSGIHKATIPGLRLYLHCGPPDKPGSVTLYGINVTNSSRNIKIRGKFRKRILVYLLQAPNNNLTSEIILLNGNTLEIDASEHFPNLDPVESRGVVQIPPLSIGFWVFPNANFVACS